MRPDSSWRFDSPRSIDTSHTFAVRITFATQTACRLVPVRRFSLLRLFQTSISMQLTAEKKSFAVSSTVNQVEYRCRIRFLSRARISFLLPFFPSTSYTDTFPPSSSPPPYLYSPLGRDMSRFYSSWNFSNPFT